VLSEEAPQGWDERHTAILLQPFEDQPREIPGASEKSTGTSG
jgi:hypothetical protein